MCTILERRIGRKYRNAFISEFPEGELNTVLTFSLVFKPQGVTCKSSLLSPSSSQSVSMVLHNQLWQLWSGPVCSPLWWGGSSLYSTHTTVEPDVLLPEAQLSSWQGFPRERWMDRWQAEFVTNSQFDVTASPRLGKLRRSPCRYLLCLAQW